MSDSPRLRGLRIRDERAERLDDPDAGVQHRAERGVVDVRLSVPALAVMLKASTSVVRSMTPEQLTSVPVGTIGSRRRTGVPP